MYMDGLVLHTVCDGPEGLRNGDIKPMTFLYNWLQSSSEVQL